MTAPATVGAAGRRRPGPRVCGPRAWVLLAAASALGLVGLQLAAARPAPRQREPGPQRATRPGSSSPLLPLLFAIVVAELADGALDAKAVALLGVLAACGCALRLPGGVTGFEPVFFLLIPAGRVLGRGFGFVLGALDDVRVGAAHRRRRSVAAVPDVRRGVGRLLRRLPPAGQGSARAVLLAGLRLRRRPGLRPAARLLVLAVRRQRGHPSCRSCRGRRSPRTCGGSGRSTSPPRSGATCPGPSPTRCSCCWSADRCSPPCGGWPARPPSARR